MLTRLVEWLVDQVLNPEQLTQLEEHLDQLSSPRQTGKR